VTWMDISELREKIDSIDNQITSLIKERIDVCAQIAEYKKDNNMPIYDKSREEEHKKMLRSSVDPIYADDIEELFSDIMSMSRRRQKILNSRFGLIGGKLGHSYSPQIHRVFGGYDYDLIELQEEELESFLKEKNFDGINVTIPYKKAVIPYCDELTERASAIGSVNTIVKRVDGTLLGDNTDYAGFKWLVERSGAVVTGKKCLVMGDGGVSPTVKTVLHDLGASEIVTVSRKGNVKFEDIPDHRDAEIIVNATPVGMYPENGKTLVDLKTFDHLSGVFDVVYNPNRTKMIMDAESLGIPCSGGLPMLIAQGREACELFTQTKVSASRQDEGLRLIENQMKNIALIGMPGCGKTTCARELSSMTGRTAVDIDEEIVREIGCSIPEFFAENGEEEFRNVETKVLDRFARQSGLVIATGGGVVTRNENYELLHQNSVIVFLDRNDMNHLSKEGRPVSQSKSVETLIKERMPKYKGWSELTVKCVCPSVNAETIIKELGL